MRNAGGLRRGRYPYAWRGPSSESSTIDHNLDSSALLTAGTIGSNMLCSSSTAVQLIPLRWRSEVNGLARVGLRERLAAAARPGWLARGEQGGRLAFPVVMRVKISKDEDAGFEKA